MLGLLLVTGLLSLAIIDSYLHEDFKSRLLARGALAANATQFSVESASTIGGIQRFAASIGAEDDFNFVVVVVGSGDDAHVLASSERAYIGQLSRNLQRRHNHLDLQEALQSHQAQHNFNQLNESLFSYAIPILISNVTRDGKPLGGGALLISLNTSKLQIEKENALLQIGGLLLATLFLLGFTLYFLVNRFVLMPQNRLLKTVHERQSGGKSLAIVKGKNELAQLSIAFNQMLQESDKNEILKSQFISTVSHELRTPLTSIRGSLGLIVGSYKAQIPDVANRLLDIASRNCTRLIMLVNDLLDIEKMTSGELEFNFKRVNLVTLAQQSIEANSTYALDSDIQLNLTQAPSTANIWGDEHRLLQVFSNLISNAIKFSDKGSQVEVKIQTTPDNYRVEVKDYGRGIPDEFREHAFSRFSQADSSDTRDQGGTGLGLNICKMILERHHGEIDYTSKIAQGSEFFFEIKKYS